jgi:outer membrane autotransporter protein
MNQRIGDYDIPAVGGSFEVGKRFDFAGERFFVEPQAQLAGVWEKGMDYTASNGLRVHWRRSDFAARPSRRPSGYAL